MNRLISAILALVLLFGLAACQESDGKNPTETSVDSLSTQESEETMSKFQGWMSNGFDKITEAALCPDNAAESWTVRMAKNEAESCQLSLRSPERHPVLYVTLEGEAEGITAQLFREHTINTGGSYTPDPLAPLSSGKITLLKNVTTTFLIRFTADEQAAAGEYAYTLKVADKDQVVLGQYSIRVHVWDFALPEAPSSATAVGLYPVAIKKHHGSSDAETTALYKAYYDTLLEYKVSAYDLPYDILDQRADAYMSNPRVTAFRVPTCDGDDARLLEIYAKLCTNPVWLEKAYFYPLDEPTSKEMLDKLAELTGRLHRLCPEIRVCTPFFVNRDYDADTDQITFMTGKTTLWCPKSYMYITSNVYSDAQLKKYPPFPERMEERLAAGDDVWWYVCWEPGDPYCNLFVDQLGIQHRILFWQQYQNHVNGFLYWGANYWMGTENPWDDMATVKDLSPDVYGDGSLLYNGNNVGIEGACGSLRLEAVRDGVEDNDLLALAEELFGYDWVMEKIDQVTTSLTKYIKNGEKFSEVRKSIGDAIEAELKKL